MPDITVQQAIDLIAKELEELADGAERPPQVEFDVEWLDVSTPSHRAWVPRINIQVSTMKTVSISDL